MYETVYSLDDRAERPSRKVAVLACRSGSSFARRSVLIAAVAAIIASSQSVVADVISYARCQAESFSWHDTPVVVHDYDRRTATDPVLASWVSWQPCNPLQQMNERRQFKGLA